jgi:hypothetical protein
MISIVKKNILFERSELIFFRLKEIILVIFTRRELFFVSFLLLAQKK